MLALATTRQGDVPLFCQALNGNASDKVSLLAAVEALAEQLRTADADPKEREFRIRRVAAKARRRLRLPASTPASPDLTLLLPVRVRLARQREPAWRTHRARAQARLTWCTAAGVCPHTSGS